MELTQSLEDYLEAIWVIGLDSKIVRVKDLMKYFNYKVSSVNQALKALIKKGLINHEKYGYIELTEKGLIIAQEIYEKHKTLSNFFAKFLDVPEDIAVKDACNIEHYISNKTYRSLISFVSYLQKINFSIDDFKKFKKNKPILKKAKRVYLNELKPGERGIIKKIDAPISIKQKLLSMGLSTNEKFSVEKIAPFGGPIDIKIKDYHLSLRQDEAKMILIEKENK